MAATTKVVLVIEYDGRRYHGFQWQAGLLTIQGEIEKALGGLTGESTRVIGASRTDTGVHARGQVISFRTGSSLPLLTFVKGLNYYLPRDIAVKAAYRVRDTFNVRRHALSREYNYYIFNSLTRSPIRMRYSYLVGGELNIEAMNQASQTLIGEHDFASFASSVEVKLKSTVRRVFKAGVTKGGELIVFNIVANSFLSHQVRNTVGALIRVGLGRMRIDEFCSIMEAKQFGLAGPAALPHGLCLMQVSYPRPLEEEI